VASPELTRRYLAAVADQRKRFGNAAAAIAARSDDFATFAADLTPVTIEAMNRARTLTSGYLSRSVGRTHVIDPRDMPDLPGFFAGVMDDPALVASRAKTAAADVVTWTTRQSSEIIDQREPRIVGWRRALSGSACSWCSLVATQRYRSAASAALNGKHDHCGCVPVEIVGTDDPGRVINAVTWAEIQASRAA